MTTRNPRAHNNELIVRIVTLQGEIYRVPGGDRTLRAVSGKAWITFAGRDIILSGGDRVTLAGNDDFAVVSALGKAPLVLEVLGKTAEPPRGIALTAPNLQAL